MNKWLAVIGSRAVTSEMQADIERDVCAALDDGWSIVTGGSTGVDHVAAQTVYNADLAERLRIFLPLALDNYIASFRQRVVDGKADHDDTEAMITLLLHLRELPDVIHETSEHRSLTPAAFHDRNQQIVDQADRLIAYRRDVARPTGYVHGTDHTVEHAQSRGIPVRIYRY